MSRFGLLAFPLLFVFSPVNFIFRSLSLSNFEAVMTWMNGMLLRKGKDMLALFEYNQSMHR